MYKKLLASLALGMGVFSLPVLAFAEPGRCPSIEVAITGAWLAADGVDTDYAINRTDLSGLISNNRNAPDNVPSGVHESVQPKYKLGGGIALNYRSPCWYNLGVSYFAIRHTSVDEITAGTQLNPAVAPILIPATVIDGSNNALTADSRYNFHYSFANIELGSVICFISDCLTVNPKLGLTYARFRNNQFTTYTGITDGSFLPGTSDQVDMHSRYRGVGPSIGVDICFLFCEDFSLFGNLRYSALSGTLQGIFENTSFDSTGVPVRLSSGAVTFHQNRHMVKLFQSELGLALNYDWCGRCVEIKAGYTYTQAMDAVNRVTFLDDVAPNNALKQILNASFHGPFIRLSARFGL